MEKIKISRTDKKYEELLQIADKYFIHNIKKIKSFETNKYGEMVAFTYVRNNKVSSVGRQLLGGMFPSTLNIFVD